ncbi:MAG: phosphate ABC transporter substrate-binding protein [Anaerosomatales bacterium]|nr:phosphate ABC transporter substrate-binding protein [Anaerosomatales bacterium]MDI6843623.1 phosphate ABC transporter substrate-binding protein [Anaerosomatales bacterium]
MKKVAVLAFALALAASVGLAGCGQKQEPAAEPTVPETPALSGTINIQGSDTMVNLATAWAEKFMDENPDVEVSVQGGGSGTGIAALINGTVDFANASREMKEEEIAEAKSKGIQPVEHKVAIDGIAVVVNKANPVEGLTLEQLGKIFRGEITNWKDVGGPDKPIVLLSRDSSSGTYEYFKEAVIGKDKEYAKTAKLLPSSQAIVDEVKANDAGIGYVGLGYVSDDVKVVAVDGVKASVETAKDGSYPIARYLYMYSNGEVSGLLKAYLDWVTGPEGQALVADEGFVPLQ